MPTSLQLRTHPEILARMFSTAKVQLGVLDANVGAFLRAIFDAASLSDADQYVQIGKVMDLFDIANCKDDDLDRRALDYGARIFKDMRRRAAETSIGNVVVGDGTLQLTADVTTDLVATQTAFNIDDATGWPTSGTMVLERGTLREETILFTRSGTVINVQYPVSGLVNPHISGGSAETVATQALLDAPMLVGATSAVIQLGMEAAWPLNGTVIFERDTIRRESRAYTRVGQTLTIAATGFAHAAGTVITLSTFGSDRSISSGSVCFVPETAGSKRVTYRTTSAGILYDGDYVTALVPIESEDVGLETQVASNQIVKWSTEPFAGATVTNPLPTVRGADREKDEDYIERIRAFVQSLGRATALALEQLTGGKRDPFSNALIAFAQAVEPVAPGLAQLYISDGSPTFTIDYQAKLSRYVIISDARVNDRRGRLGDYGPYQMVASPPSARTPRIYKSTERGVATSVGVNYLEDTTQAFVVNALTGMYLKTDDDQFFEITSNTAIRINVAAGGATPSLGSYAVFALDSTDPLVPGTDYIFNVTNGDLELVTPLVEHDALVAVPTDDLSSAAYIYSRGLAAYAQRLVNGDRTALDDFPGIKALGCHVQVVVPTVISPEFVIQVIPVSGVTDDDLRDQVKAVVLAYVNSLGIGVTVVLSEIIRLVKSLTGVRDIRILQPTSNPSIPDGSIPRITDSNISVV